jgi:hypothetical protein
MNQYLFSDARISRCGKYRYLLRRQWSVTEGICVFVGLNPSTADAEKDDPTIRRCVGFAKDLGYGSMWMVNLFAYRATSPKEMMRALDPIGPGNNDTLRSVAGSHMIIAAWGTHGTYMERDKQVKSILHGRLHTLRETQGGHPAHPLYLPKHLKPVFYA